MEYDQPASMKFLQKLMPPNHFVRLFLKSWGFEYWFENNEKYCGKVIQVRHGEWSSFGAFHYHKIKDESFLVISGTLIIDVLDLTNVALSAIPNHNEIQTQHDPLVRRFHLKPFEYIRVHPGVLHRFSGYAGEALFTETSTTHDEEDSYRIVDPIPEEQFDYPIRRMTPILPYNTEEYSYIKENQQLSTEKGLKTLL